MRSKKFNSKTLSELLEIALKGNLKTIDAFRLADKVDKIAPAPPKKGKGNKK